MLTHSESSGNLPNVSVVKKQPIKSWGLLQPKGDVQLSFFFLQRWHWGIDHIASMPLEKGTFIYINYTYFYWSHSQTAMRAWTWDSSTSYNFSIGIMLNANCRLVSWLYVNNICSVLYLTRFKCPYCPVEMLTTDTRQIYFWCHNYSL